MVTADAAGAARGGGGAGARRLAAEPAGKGRGQAGRGGAEQGSGAGQRGPAASRARLAVAVKRLLGAAGGELWRRLVGALRSSSRLLLSALLLAASSLPVGLAFLRGGGVFPGLGVARERGLGGELLCCSLTKTSFEGMAVSAEALLKFCQWP